MVTDSVVICIPTKRPPPIRTLESYDTGDFKVMVVADPDVREAHQEYYFGKAGITVVNGARGLGAQCAACYRIAKIAGYPYWFKMDDDLAPRTFIHRDGSYPLLDYVIFQAWDCLNETNTTLVGFHNGANRSWMKGGFARTWGLIHGGANLSISAMDPTVYMNANLVRGEDVWRTCAHREHDKELNHGPFGAVGRVQFIGFDKSKSTAIAGGSVAATAATQDRLDQSKYAILQRFPTMVSCVGTREIFNGKFTIPNWRMRRR
jgi:hypothetical protein